MLKLATFSGITPKGDPLVQLFRQGDEIRKVAGALMPSIQDWLSTYKSDKDKIALLVNALGASEYWGQNVNGDIFPESALVHDCNNHPGQQHPHDDFTGKIVPPYGAWTFKQYAKPYVHHKNKDPTRAFGEVAHWCWNPRMHRVELVVVIDRHAALEHGAQHVVDRIDAGEYPDVSMGCKVPFDVCTICNNKSKTRHDYCKCITEFGMGTILKDGRRVGVTNTYPRFFDISFVFIGADKTAKVMAKLGSGLLVPLSAVEGAYLYGEETSEMVKAASEIIDPKETASTFEAELQAEGTGMPSKHIRARGEFEDGHGRATITRLAPPPEETTNLLIGRVDKQEPQSVLEDSELHTNQNDTVEDDDPRKEAFDQVAAMSKEAIFLSDAHATAVLAAPFASGALGGAAAAAATSKKKGKEKVKDIATGAAVGTAAAIPGGVTGLTLGMPFDGTGVVGANVGAAALGALASREVTKQSAVIPARLRQRIAEETARVATQHGRKRLAQGLLAGTGVALPTGFVAGRMTADPEKSAAWETNSAERNLLRSHKVYKGLHQFGDKALVAIGAKKPKLAAAQWKIGPPPMPNREKYPFVGTLNFRGLEIGVENAPGTWRTGKGWKTLMKNPYGEFLHGKAGGTDGDKLDVFVGPNRQCKNVFIVHQNFVHGPKKGQYDEDKVMLGFDTPAQAKKAYLAHYDTDKYFRSMTTMAFPLFKRALIGGQVDGEKVAALDEELRSYREDMKLEDLFGHPTPIRRQRTWKDTGTGKEHSVTGSGMTDELGEALKEKKASAQAQPVTPLEALKMAVDKRAAEKWADIVKEIGPDKAVGKITERLDTDEPSIPSDVLDDMGCKCDLQQALATPSLMGMVLKPEEFQRIMLGSMGKSDLADSLGQAGVVFKPEEGEQAPCQSLSSSHFLPELMQKLLPLLGDKSYLGPVMRKRIIRIVIKKPGEEPAPEKTAQIEMKSPLLSKVASAYNWYRMEQMKLAAEAPQFIMGIPTLSAAVYDLDDSDLFHTKEAGSGLATGVALGSIPLTAMYSAHLRGQQRMGKQHGMIGQFVADHPWITSLGTAAALRGALGSRLGQAVTRDAGNSLKEVWHGKPA